MRLHSFISEGFLGCLLGLGYVSSASDTDINKQKSDGHGAVTVQDLILGSKQENQACINKTH